MLHYRWISSPLGGLRLLAGAEGLKEVSFEHRAGALPEGAREDGGRHPALAEAERQLREYFAGTGRAFDLPLAPEGTAFQRRVWSALRSIPYGCTWSYGELARRIGRPGAARAVGAANHANPIAIIVPCHRVVGRDGSLTGYGGGLWIKRWLLDFEAAQAGAAPGASSGFQEGSSKGASGSVS